MYSQLSPCGHLAIADTPLIRTAANPRLKLQTFDWNKLPLLRTYGHFAQFQRHNFIVLSVVITDSERNFLTLEKQKQFRHDKYFSARYPTVGNHKDWWGRFLVSWKPRIEDRGSGIWKTRIDDQGSGKAGSTIGDLEKQDRVKKK